MLAGAPGSHQQVLQPVEVVQVFRPLLGVAASAAHMSVLPGDADPDDAHRAVGGRSGHHHQPAAGGPLRANEVNAERKPRPHNHFAAQRLQAVAPVIACIDDESVCGK